jgi:hypothetical protein
MVNIAQSLDSFEQVRSSNSKLNLSENFSTNYEMHPSWVAECSLVPIARESTEEPHSMYQIKVLQFESSL